MVRYGSADERSRSAPLCSNQIIGFTDATDCPIRSVVYEFKTPIMLALFS